MTTVARLQHEWLQASLDLLHQQRHDTPPDHPRAGNDLVYSHRCRVCREVTAQPPPAATAKQPEGARI